MKLFFGIWILFLMVISFENLNAQIGTYDSIPSIYQLYPRDETDSDSAIVTIKGSVDSVVMYDSVTVNIIRNGNFWKSINQNLNYSGNSADFNLKLKIYADTIEFRFEMNFWNGGSATPDSIADSVVCGDVFLINGQSNAAGVDYQQTGSATNQWVRTFGNVSDESNPVKEDTSWGIARGGIIGTSPPRQIGVWGLRLGKLLVGESDIPLCIINGASGGSDISEHHRNENNHEDLSSIYGRLLYRAKKANVANNVRAIIWWQGESDAGNLGYFSDFELLYNQWREDYPNIGKIYTTQIHPGWDGDAAVFREIQRVIPDSLPDVAIMTAFNLGEQTSDQKHFLYDAYEKYALFISRQVARDFYGLNYSVDIDPASIDFTFKYKPDEIGLAFRDNQKVYWPVPDDTIVGGVTVEFKDHFFTDDQSVSFIGGKDTTILGTNVILLKTSTPTTATKLTYLPPEHYVGVSSIWYYGPWLLNTGDVGALSFYGVPINPVYGNFPTAPTALNAVAVSSLQIDLIWIESIDPQFGISFYKIYRDNNFVGQSDITSYNDMGLNPGTTYVYEISAVNGVGLESPRSAPDTATTSITGIAGFGEKQKPARFKLYQNYPNPFNPITYIEYEISKAGLVKLLIFNILGERVKTLVNQSMMPGTYGINWNGQDDNGRPVSSGIYFYQLSLSGNESFIENKQMHFLK